MSTEWTFPKNSLESDKLGYRYIAEPESNFPDMYVSCTASRHPLQHRNRTSVGTGPLRRPVLVSRPAMATELLSVCLLLCAFWAPFNLYAY